MREKRKIIAALMVVVLLVTGDCVVGAKALANGNLTETVAAMPKMAAEAATSDAISTGTDGSTGDNAADSTSGSVIDTIQTPNTSVAYKKGAVFSWKNYTYTVVKAPTTKAAGQIYVKSVVSAASAKTSLTVQSSITVKGYTYQVVGITKEAFMSCTALKKVTIKSGTTFIGKRAFRGVSTLQSVILPDTVTMIKSGAFRECTGLRQITLPENLTTIRKRAFYNCGNLKAVLVLSKKINIVGQGVFKNTKSGCYLVVPSGKKSTYRTVLDASGAKKIILYTY